MVAQGTWFIQNFPYILAGIAGVGAVIAFHELGHFLFCKLFNVHAPSFSIGFGPQILKKKIGETTFSLSLIPVGGYVEIEMGQTEGMEKSRSIDNKSYFQKMCIAWGGIIFNMIFAYVCLVGLSMSGIPSNPFLMHKGSYSIKKIVAASPAQKAGIISGDRLLTVNETDVSGHVSTLFKTLEPLANKETIITLERNGQVETFVLTLGSRKVKGKEYGVLGIEEFLFPSLQPVSFLKAVRQAFTLTVELITSTAHSLANAFKKRSAEGFSGPLMMISLTIASAGQGIKLFLIFLTVISVSLGVLNVIPLPILDGGRILTFTIEAIIRRPLPEKIVVATHYATWALMIFLFIYLTIKDVKDLF
jgi:regulator of sigma E protease